MFFSMLSAAHTIKKTIYLYAGPGVGEQSLMQAFSALTYLLKTNHNVTKIQPEEIKTLDWEAHAACFVMPGGADCLYQKHLNPTGNERIKRYVETGGSYLGLCAGGYYGGRKVEFALGTDLELIRDRDLQFFPGVVRGPVLAPYDYKTDSGARAAYIQWGKRIIRLYFNGGGCFVDADKMPNISVLANYKMEDNTQRPAVIEATSGLGKVVLSGVHFEFNPELLNQNNGLPEDIILTLKEHDSERIEFMHYIFEKLRLI